MPLTPEDEKAKAKQDRPKISPATEQLIRDLARDEIERHERGLPAKQVETGEDSSSE